MKNFFDTAQVETTERKPSKEIMMAKVNQDLQDIQSKIFKSEATLLGQKTTLGNLQVLADMVLNDRISHESYCTLRDKFLNGGFLEREAPRVMI